MIRKPIQIRIKRRRVKRIWRDCPWERLEAAAKNAKYRGSPYHCTTRNKGIVAAVRPYPLASKCADKWTHEVALKALVDGIKAGLVSDDWRGGFPRNVWFLDGVVVYEALLSNQVLGEYHGYPLNSREEWPTGLE